MIGPADAKARARVRVCTRSGEQTGTLLYAPPPPGEVQRQTGRVKRGSTTKAKVQLDNGAYMNAPPCDVHLVDGDLARLPGVRNNRCPKCRKPHAFKALGGHDYVCPSCQHAWWVEVVVGDAELSAQHFGGRPYWTTVWT